MKLQSDGARHHPHIKPFLIPERGVEFRCFTIGLDLYVRYTVTRDPLLYGLQQRSTDTPPPPSGTHVKLFDAGEVGRGGDAGTVGDHGDANRSATGASGKYLEVALLDRAPQPVHELVRDGFAVSQGFFEKLQRRGEIFTGYEGDFDFVNVRGLRR